MSNRYLLRLAVLALIVSTASLLVLPALSKPNQIEIIVKGTSSRKPLVGLGVAIVVGDDDAEWPKGTTDAHGKAVFPTPAAFSVGTTFEVALSDDGFVTWWSEWGGKISSRLSERVTISTDVFA